MSDPLLLLAIADLAGLTALTGIVVAAGRRGERRALLIAVGGVTLISAVCLGLIYGSLKLIAENWQP